VAISAPPTVLTVNVAAPPSKIPTALELNIIEASVRLPWASVMMTVIGVVWPLPIGLLAAVTVTLAAAPPELPEPVVVPLVMLVLLELSEELHPVINKTVRPIKAQKQIKVRNLFLIDSNPNY
jgi:hypothetical protein